MMQLRLKALSSIAVRLSASIIVVVLATSIAVATLIIRDEEVNLTRDLRVRSLQLAEILSTQVTELLLYEEKYALYSLLQSYLDPREGIVVGAEIFDEKGELVVSQGPENGDPGRLGDQDLAGLPRFTERPRTEAEAAVFDLLYPVTSKSLGTIGYLRLGITSKQLAASLLNIKRQVRLLILAIVLAGAAAALWMARMLIRPVILLNRAVHQLGAGDLGTEIEVVGVGEIGDLARTFNTMSRQLNESVGRLRETQEALVKREKLYALGQFSAGLAHEIKNPLTAVKMLVQRAEDFREPLEGRDLDIITGELNRIDHIVSQFLANSRSSVILLQEDDLNQVVNAVHLITRPQIEKGRIDFRLSLADAPLRVNMHTDSIRQVLLNLILNAVQATPAGGRMTLETRETERGGMVRLVDSGCGIPSENLEKIFDPFFTTKSDGTGLGLAVVWNIIENHHGHIDIRSTPGAGTEVEVVIPYA